MERSMKKGKPGLMAFLNSEAGQCFVEVAKMFIAVYTPYALLASAVAFVAHALLTWSHVSSLAGVACAALGGVLRYASSPPACYLLDYACFKPSDEYKLSAEVADFFAKDSGDFTVENIEFQRKVLLKSGLGDETYGPPYTFKGGLRSLHEAREEILYMICGAFDLLLAKASLLPTEIDILITHVCVFSPTPSIASLIVNRYKMKETIKAYNLAGMGCAAGVLAIDMAKEMLRVHKRKYAVILGNEGLTLSSYHGNDRSMLLANCLFRAGSYALLLSNKKEEREIAKMELLYSTRTTTASSDASLNCIFQCEDEYGIEGTSLSSKLLGVAGDALALSMPKLIPHFMPLAELFKAASTFLRRKFLNQHQLKPYLPDFKKAFTHFCLHPGGRLVVESIGKTLGLGDSDLEPSRMALHRFGNTSSSGLWYAFAYMEAKNRVKGGQTVWQVSLGSGFKCNHAVWRVLSDLPPPSGYNPWLDCIHRYPMPIIATHNAR